MVRAYSCSILTAVSHVHSLFDATVSFPENFVARKFENSDKSGASLGRQTDRLGEREGTGMREESYHSIASRRFIAGRYGFPLPLRRARTKKIIHVVHPRRSWKWIFLRHWLLLLYLIRHLIWDGSFLKECGGHAMEASQSQLGQDNEGRRR